jgi:hypothetical protein
MAVAHEGGRLMWGSRVLCRARGHDRRLALITFGRTDSR